MDKILKTLIVLLVIVIAVHMLTACESMNNEGEKVAVDRFSYRKIEIEGMTCIWYSYSAWYQGYGGLTCNWDEYQG
jgi:hypothetical protein